MPRGGRREGAGRKHGSLNKVTNEVRQLAEPYSKSAIETLAQIMNKSVSDAARVAASREILDRAFGKASQAITGADGKDLIPEAPVSDLEVARRMVFLLERGKLEKEKIDKRSS